MTLTKPLHSHFPSPLNSNQEKFICLTSYISARFPFILAYPSNLKANPSQQGEDDGYPSRKTNLEVKGNQGNLN